MSVRRRAIQARVKRDREWREGMDRLKAALWNAMERVKRMQRRAQPQRGEHE